MNTDDSKEEMKKTKPTPNTVVSKSNSKIQKPRRLAYHAQRWATGFILMVITVLCLASTLINLFPKQPDLQYSDFIAKAEAGEVKEAQLFSTTSTYFNVTLNNGNKHRVPAPNNDTFKLTVMKLVPVELVVDTPFNVIVSGLLQYTMLIILYLVGSYLLKSAWNIGAKVVSPTSKRLKDAITFEDVAGLGEILDEVTAVVSMLNDTSAYTSSGAEVSKGILLYGPPGTGKTLIAKAIAGEAKVPFFAVSGSDFSESFIGVGSRKVRQMMNTAKNNAPCILFIDEIDSLGSNRKYDTDVSKEQSNILNALLTELDGMSSHSGVLVIAATNQLNSLDKALLRAGRFDRHIYVALPNNAIDRNEIIAVHLRGKKLDPALTIDDISLYFKGFSGASIESCLNEAVIESVSKGRQGLISLADVDSATTKHLLQGTIKKPKNPRFTQIASVHEAGHAIVASGVGRNVLKVTITGAGNAGGLTLTDDGDKDDLPLLTSSEIEKLVTTMYGGLLAEDILLGDHSEGCISDLENATSLLEVYVKSYGMGDSLIRVQAGDMDFANTIKPQLLELSKVCEDRAKAILLENKDELIRLSKQLEDELTVYNYNLPTPKEV